MKIVLVTGGFDPLHSGHIEYFKAAKQLGNLLVVGINSDDWLARKKGKAFMPAVERKAIIENLYQVHKVIEFNDNDGSAIDAIRQVKEMFPRNKVIFANGGDRTRDNIPEMVFDDVEFVFGVGGTNKANSSSWILDEWKAPKTIRPWGYYRVLHTIGNQVKVKELTVDPGKTLSMQRHQHRTELWFIAEGEAGLNWEYGGEKIKTFKTETIQPNEWHQLYNPTESPLRVIEIQYGAYCEEEDIERK
jgi:D-beta-D-heptose 7-phosphate kinase/D-beta-D-heptose 1-phosphate adenosyltransferase